MIRPNKPLNLKQTNDFNSFCTRMWLDNEDENLGPHAAGNRLTKEEYVDKWYDWLLEKWQNRTYGTNNE